jgi:hypothetical protein
VKAAKANPGVSQGHSTVQMVFHWRFNPSGDKFPGKVEPDKKDKPQKY